MIGGSLSIFLIGHYNRGADNLLSLPVLTSRTVGYGPVCPVVWEERPYPYEHFVISKQEEASPYSEQLYVFLCRRNIQF